MPNLSIEKKSFKSVFPKQLSDYCLIKRKKKSKYIKWRIIWATTSPHFQVDKFYCEFFLMCTNHVQCPIIGLSSVVYCVGWHLKRYIYFVHFQFNSKSYGIDYCKILVYVARKFQVLIFAYFIFLFCLLSIVVVNWLNFWSYFCHLHLLTFEVDLNLVLKRSQLNIAILENTNQFVIKCRKAPK